MAVLEGSDDATAVDAVEAGVTAVELDTAEQYYVGYGGLPTEDGVVELDAAIMDATRSRYGAVMAIQGTRRAVSVARAVMDRSVHNVLVGAGASKFAAAQGFEREETLTPQSRAEWERHMEARRAAAARGEDMQARTVAGAEPVADAAGHDTVGCIAMDKHGRIAAATSTSGWAFSLPGRVGDAPLIGAGIYAEDGVGAAVATGDGEQIMRTCMAHTVVECMRAGMAPAAACDEGIRRMRQVLGLPARAPRPVPAPGAGAGAGAGTSAAFGPEATSPADAGSTDPDAELRVVAAVLAMNAHGDVGASTTIGPSTPHAGRPFFPFVDSVFPSELQAAIDPAQR